MLTYLMLHPTPKAARTTSNRPIRARVTRTLRRLLGPRAGGPAGADARRTPVELLHDVAMGGTAASAATRMMRSLPAGRAS